ncbi:MAG TPA: hypothetical protein PKN95_13820 [Verrucomicrobiota bacterium]|nr:hypothetical protein [Verrucomicrobiota bacterium]HNT15302.1 hypothetical protein [Verrucomicrobiota bacterium]
MNTTIIGRDGALRRQRRVQRRNDSHGTRGMTDVFRPLLRGRGQRSALSLPRKLRPLAIREINERPLFGASDKLFPNRIFQNVIGLLPPALVVPQAMFKKIALPADADFFCRPFLPFADDALDGFVGRRKGNQRVQMIRHQQKQMRPPQESFLPMADSLEQTNGNFRRGELIAISQFRVGTLRCGVRTAQRAVPTIVKSFPAVDGDEIDFALRVNPQWNVVWQCLSFGNVHDGKLCDASHDDKANWANWVGTPRGAVRARKAGARFILRHKIPAALPPGTSQRDVPTKENAKLIW